MLRRPPVSLATIRRELANGESLVEFVLDAKRSYVLQVSRAGLDVHEIPERAEIDRLVNQFLSAVKNKRESADMAKAVYERILSPVLPKRATSVIIVPDGSLHLVPFGALVDENGETLVKRLSVMSVPSATVYSTLKADRKRMPATKPFLGVAFSPEKPDPMQLASNTRGVFDLQAPKLEPLQFAREEIDEAAKVLGKNSVTLEGTAASEAALKALASRFSNWSIRDSSGAAGKHRKRPTSGRYSRPVRYGYKFGSSGTYPNRFL
jgi:CHAT domain-containing protein